MKRRIPIRAQFSVLLEITRPPEATGRWLETRADPPRPGSFCMVGDFQQSIWHDRADLSHYQRVHDALVNSEAGEALKFSVTFRLDQEQLDFINATFREILNETDGQVPFVELEPRPTVLPGQVIRLALDASLLEGPDKPKDPEKPKDREIARAEAQSSRALAEGMRPGKTCARAVGAKSRFFVRAKIGSTPWPWRCAAKVCRSKCNRRAISAPTRPPTPG